MEDVHRNDRYTRTAPGGRALWRNDRLWRAADGLPVREVPLSDIAELDQDCWFGERHLPTCRAVAEHARRIRDADLSYPVILSADGRLMDGVHRAAKAYLEGRTVISAVRFTVDPEPDRFIPDGVAW
jgi:hypothetical protein